MDLRRRLSLIDERLRTLETVSRLRSASISEGVTEFSGDGKLSVDHGGSFIIDNGAAMGGGSWEIGVNEDGTTFANIGDLLLYTHEAEPVSQYITSEIVAVPITEAITKVSQDVPEGAEYTIVVGSINVMAETETRSVVRVRSEGIDISMVVLEGQTQTIPLIMKFDSTIEFEIHVSSSFSVDTQFEAITQWEVDQDAEKPVDPSPTE